MQSKLILYWQIYLLQKNAIPDFRYIFKVSLHINLFSQGHPVQVNKLEPRDIVSV